MRIARQWATARVAPTIVGTRNGCPYNIVCMVFRVGADSIRPL